MLVFVAEGLFQYVCTVDELFLILRFSFCPFSARHSLHYSRSLSAFDSFLWDVVRGSMCMQKSASDDEGGSENGYGFMRTRCIIGCSVYIDIGMMSPSCGAAAAVPMPGAVVVHRPAGSFSIALAFSGQHGML